jgi:hypothetical protein
MLNANEQTVFSARLIRWSGSALMLAGLLIAIPTLFHPSDADPHAFQSAAWAPVHALLIVGAILSLFGLIGLYRAQAEHTGALGLAGFILNAIGTALVVAALVADAFVIPVLAADPAGQALLDPAGPLFGGALGLVFLLMGVTFALGTILLGFATARAGVLPRWAGALILVGGPLLAFTPPLPTSVGLAGALLLGAGYLWAGYAIWAGQAAGAMVQSHGASAAQ